MNRALLLALLTLLPGSAFGADDRGKLIFEDDFNREDLPGEKEQLENGWNTNSKTRAKGNKQVFFKDGAMYIKTHAEADHAASVTHPAEFKDGTVEMRFKLEGEKDVLGLDFADLKLKEVWAGHLFKVDFATGQVSINDLKTGNMNLKTREARLAGTLTDEQKAVVAKSSKRFPVKIAAGEWHTLTVTVAGDTITAGVDGKEVGQFTSPGFEHPTKRMLRLSVPRAAVIDDIKIWSK